MLMPWFEYDREDIIQNVCCISVLIASNHDFHVVADRKLERSDLFQKQWLLQHFQRRSFWLGQKMSNPIYVHVRYCRIKGISILKLKCVSLLINMQYKTVQNLDLRYNCLVYPYSEKLIIV